MTKARPPEFFTDEVAKAYDERNKNLAPIAENMHFLIRLILKGLPARARILSVGVGTGAEILSLAKMFPEWSFTGIDPSSSMLEVCKERLDSAGVAERCDLIQSYVHDLPPGEHFDAALSILVGHFIHRAERLSFLQEIISRVKEGGFFINTEISFDLTSAQFPLMLKNWEQVQTLMGATPEGLAALPQQLREVLTVLSHEEVEELLRKTGIKEPVRFFQAFLVAGWYGIKSGS